MGYKFLADQNQLYFFPESGTYADQSYAGSRVWIGMVQDHTPDEGAGIIPIRYQGSTDRNVDTFANGPLDYAGTFSYYPQNWRFLGYAIGSTYEPTACGSHVISETNSDDASEAISTQSLNSFTLVDSKKTPTAGSNFIRTFKGCMVDSYAVNMAEGEMVSCEVGYKAQSTTFSSGAITAVTPVTTAPYLWSNIAIHLPSGTALTNCTEFSLTINNNLESRYPLNGSRTVEELIPLNRDYEVSSTFVMDATNAKTLYDQYYIGGSTFNTMIKMLATAGSAYIILSGCKITDMEVPSPVEGLHDQTCTIVPQHVDAVIMDSAGSYHVWA